jgi:tRNA U38,U39,U40 pseudouridine synthase TruA
MVRIVAGTLMEVGRGRIGPEDIPRIIEARDRRAAGPTLPPQGLCLRWIWYGSGTPAEGAASAGGPPVEDDACVD